MISYSYEYLCTLGDAGTGRWQRSDQSVSSATSTEKAIGRARMLEAFMERAANGQRKWRVSVDMASIPVVGQLVELSKSYRVPKAVRDSLGLTSSNRQVVFSRIKL